MENIALVNCINIPIDFEYRGSDFEEVNKNYSQYCYGIEPYEWEEEREEIKSVFLSSLDHFNRLSWTNLTLVYYPYLPALFVKLKIP